MIEYNNKHHSFSKEKYNGTLEDFFSQKHKHDNVILERDRIMAEIFIRFTKK